MPPSQVWHYFKKIDNGKKARCSLCTKTLTYCGSTSSLAGHLKNAHKICIKKESISVQRNSNIDDMEISDEEQSDDMPGTSRKSISLVPNNPIANAFQNATSFSREGEKTSKVTDALLYMIAVDNMPLCTPDKRGFTKFCKVLQPLYKAPVLKTRENLFDAKYMHLKEKIFKRLSSAKYITLTTDLWTETMNVKSFLGVTAHYVEGTEMKSVDIGATQIVERKTIANLKQELLNICETWHIGNSRVAAVVTDNGPNIVGACKAAFGPDKHLPCFAHSLNIVSMKSIDFYEVSPEAELPEYENSDDENIDDETAPSELKTIVRKLKIIVTFFKRCEAATTALINFHKEVNGGELYKKLIQEVRTRWNSLYDMIDRYLELHELVSRTLRKITTEKSSKSKPPKDLTPEEVESLTEVKKLLKPLYLVTKELCAQKNVTVSKIIPLLKMLQTNIDEILPIDSAAFNLRRKLLNNLNERFRNVDNNSILLAATILDPRFKKLHFSNTIAVANAISKIAQKVKEKLATTFDAAQTNKLVRCQSSEEDSLWKVHDNIVETQHTEADQDVADGIPIELRQYLNRPVCNRSLDPLVEWEKYKNLYPHVYEVAREYLGILATSVPCEKAGLIITLFSKAGLIITQRRNRLSSEHLNQQLFMQNISEDDWFE